MSLGEPDDDHDNVVSIGNCTGTIVAGKWILTAAHCMMKGAPPLYGRAAIRNVEYYDTFFTPAGAWYRPAVSPKSPSLMDLSRIEGLIGEGLSDDDQKNSNLTWEKTVTGTTPRCAKPYEADCLFSGGDTDRVGHFPGDACDEPIAPFVIKGTSSGSSGRMTTCTRTYYGCDGHPDGTAESTPVSCEVTAENTILGFGIGPNLPVGAGAGTELVGHTRMMRCGCLPGVSEASCGSGTGTCSRNVLLPNANWNSLTLEDSTGASLGGALIAGRYEAANKPGATYTNFDARWPYWSDLAGTLPSVGGEIWKGFLWSWVKNYNPAAAPPASSTVSATPKAERRQQWAHTTLKEETAQRFYCDTLYKRRPFDFGRMIPGSGGGDDDWRSFLERVTIPGRGEVIVSASAPGFRPIDVAPNVAPPIRDALSPDSTISLVFAADASTHWSSPFVGLLVEAETHRVVARARDDAGLASDPLDLSPVTPQVWWGGVPLNERPLGNENNATTPGGVVPLVYAVSGKNAEAFFFGEVDGNGQRGTQVRIVHLKSGTQETLNLWSDNRIERPISATYRAEDDAYYVLERVLDDNGAPSVRLVRVDRTLNLTTMAIWPISIMQQRSWSITTSDDGSLLVSSSGFLDWKLALLDLYPDGLHVVARYVGAGMLTAPAIKRKSGLYVEVSSMLSQVVVGGQPLAPNAGTPIPWGETTSPPKRIVAPSEPFDPDVLSLGDMF